MDALRNLQEEMLKVTQGESTFWFPDFELINNQLNQINSTRTEIMHSQTRREEYCKEMVNTYLTTKISKAESQVNTVSINEDLQYSDAISVQRCTSNVNIFQTPVKSVSTATSIQTTVVLETSSSDSNSEIGSAKSNVDNVVSDIQSIVIDNPILTCSNNSNNSAIENIESDAESEAEMSAKCNSIFSLVESDKQSSTNYTDLNLYTDAIVLQCENVPSKLELQHIPIDRGKCIANQSDWSNHSGGCTTSWEEYNKSQQSYSELLANSLKNNNSDSDFELQKNEETIIQEYVSENSQSHSNSDEESIHDTETINIKNEYASESSRTSSSYSKAVDYIYGDNNRGGNYVSNNENSQSRNSASRKDDSVETTDFQALDKDGDEPEEKSTSFGSRNTNGSTDPDEISQNSNKESVNDDGNVQSDNDNENVIEQSKSYNSVLSHRSVNYENEDGINDQDSDHDGESRSYSDHDAEDSASRSSNNNSQSRISEYGGY
jgi:hypothetical protein